MPTEQEIRDQARQAEMIRNEDAWPMWPRLPMKKPGTWDVAVIVPSPGKQIALIEGNMYMITPESEVTVFDDVQAVWDAGWRVD